MLQYLRQTVGAEIKNAVIVSPDAGGAKRFVPLSLPHPLPDPPPLVHPPWPLRWT
jgi:hypothetical protein